MRYSMLDDLRSLIHRFAVPHAAADPEHVWRRGRSRMLRIRTVTALATAASVMVAWSFWPRSLEDPPPNGSLPTLESRHDWTDVSQESIETGGYVFSNIEMRTAPQVDASTDLERVVIRGDIGWSNGFPGKRECSFRVYDDKGEVIGTAAGSFMAPAPTSGIIKDRIDVSGRPRGINISCADVRLDDPSGHFSFGDVSIEDGNAREPTGEQELVAVVRYTWQGRGDPSPQSCTITARDRSGDYLFERTVGLIAMDGEPHRTRFRFLAPEWARTRVEQADINCRALR